MFIFAALQYFFLHIVIIISRIKKQKKQIRRQFLTGGGWRAAFYPTCSTSSFRFAGSQQCRALGDADDSSLCGSPPPHPLPSNAKTARLIKCAGLRPSCANCDMLYSEGSLFQRSDGAAEVHRRTVMSAYEHTDIWVRHTCNDILIY